MFSGSQWILMKGQEEVDVAIKGWPKGYLWWQNCSISWLCWWLVIWIYTSDKIAQNCIHTHTCICTYTCTHRSSCKTSNIWIRSGCISIIFQVVLLYYSYAKCKRVSWGWNGWKVQKSSIISWNCIWIYNYLKNKNWITQLSKVVWAGLAFFISLIYGASGYFMPPSFVIFLSKSGLASNILSFALVMSWNNYKNSFNLSILPVSHLGHLFLYCYNPLPHLWQHILLQ